MSDPAAPWWADVQHLRPREERAEGAGSPPANRRFDRGARGERDAAIATLEHELPELEMPADPWAEPKSPEERAARWAEAQQQAWLKTAQARAQAEDAAFLAKLSGEAPAVAPAPAPEETRGADAAFADDDDATAPRGRAQTRRGTTPHGADAAAEPQRERQVADLWDGSLDKTFSSTPAWAAEDDPRLLPKGAHRIENGRRTIEIRGQVDRVHGITAPAETGAATRSGRRPARSARERFERRPDRVAMWAFVLGLLLILIAAISDPGSAGAAGF